MRPRLALRLAACAILIPLSASRAAAQEREVVTVETATQVISEIAAAPEQGISQALLRDAQGIAIIPNVVKVGFVIAGRFGRGVLMVRDSQGGWSNPVFITISGGSVGWQAGAQSTDVVLVFKTGKGIDRILKGNGKLTLGADAAIAAGPVGRQATAATDGQLQAEIFSYSRSRGLFAGVSLEGSVVHVDWNADSSFYGVSGATPTQIVMGQDVPTPPAAAQLRQVVAAVASGAALGAPVPGVPGAPGFTEGSAMQPVPPNLPVDAERLRAAVADAATRLSAPLDPTWRDYLALPENVYQAGAPPPNLDALGAAIERYDAVMKDSRYAALTGRPEFQATYDFLRRYRDAVAALAPPLPALPPPPQVGRRPTGTIR